MTQLDIEAARRVIGELAGQLRMDLEEAAEGTVTVINSNMANAIRSRTVQKGIDPCDYSLVAFGGAGPLHGAEVAAMLGIPEVIIPPYPGITSAMGLLTTDIKYKSLRTTFLVSTDIDFDRLNREFAAMRATLDEQFSRRRRRGRRRCLQAIRRCALCRTGLRAADRHARTASSTMPRSARPPISSTPCTSRSTGIASRKARSRS